MTISSYMFILLALLLYIFACVGTYLAWFRPNTFRNYIRWNSLIYRGWSPRTERQMNSIVYFWIMRIVITGVFLMCSYLIFLIAQSRV